MSSFGTPDSDLASMLGQQRTPLNYSPSPKRPPEPATSASTPSKKVKQEVPSPAKHVSCADTQEAPEQDDSAAPSSKAPAVPEQETPIQLEQAEAHAKADRILAKDMGVPKKAVTCKSLGELKTFLLNGAQSLALSGPASWHDLHKLAGPKVWPSQVLHLGIIYINLGRRKFGSLSLLHFGTIYITGDLLKPHKPSGTSPRYLHVA